MVIREIERAGVEVWSTRDGRRISLKSDASEILALVESWRDASERRKTAPRVRAAGMNRFERGYVVGGKVYGYTNVRDGEKQPVRRVVNEAEAAVVRRIFELTRDGLGLA